MDSAQQVYATNNYIITCKDSMFICFHFVTYNIFVITNWPEPEHDFSPFGASIYLYKYNGFYNKDIKSNWSQKRVMWIKSNLNVRWISYYQVIIQTI